MVKVVEGKSCEEQLRTLSLSNLEKRKLRCNYIALFSFLRGGSGEGGTELTELFYLGTSDTTHGNIQKLHQESIRLDGRKNFFTEKVVKNQQTS